MNSLTEAGVAILTGIIGVAALAVLVSNNANTSTVLTSGGTAFSNMLKAAEAPVSSGGSTMSWPTPTFGNSIPFGG